MKRKASSEWPRLFEIKGLAQCVFDYVLLDQICLWVEQAEDETKLELIGFIRTQRWNMKIICILAQHGHIDKMCHAPRPHFSDWLQLIKAATLDCFQFLVAKYPISKDACGHLLSRSYLMAQEPNFSWLWNQQKRDLSETFLTLTLGAEMPVEQFEFLLKLFCPKGSYAPWMAKFPKIALKLWETFYRFHDIPDNWCFLEAVEQHNKEAMEYFWTPLTTLEWLPFGSTVTMLHPLCATTDKCVKCNLYTLTGEHASLKMFDVFVSFIHPQNANRYPQHVASLKEAIWFVLADMHRYPMQTVCALFEQCCLYGYCGLATHIWNMTNDSQHVHLSNHFYHCAHLKNLQFLELCWQWSPSIMRHFIEKCRWSSIALVDNNQDLALFFQRHGLWTIDFDRDVTFLAKRDSCFWNGLAFDETQFKTLLRQAFQSNNADLIEYCATHGPQCLDIMFAKHLVYCVFFNKIEAIVRGGAPKNILEKMQCYSTALQNSNEIIVRHFMDMSPLTSQEQKLLWENLTYPTSGCCPKTWILILKLDIFSKQDVWNNLRDTTIFADVFGTFNYDVDFSN